MQVSGGQVVKPVNNLMVALDDLIFRAAGLAAFYGLRGDEMLFSRGQDGIVTLSLKYGAVFTLIDELRHRLAAMGVNLTILGSK